VNHEDFRIGLEFYMGGARWRVSDIGTRCVVAIKLDGCQIVRRHDDGTESRRRLTRRQANEQKYFSGPPYGVAEQVIDEYDFPACTSARLYILTGGDE
jgi:hypothetical protein